MATIENLIEKLHSEVVGRYKQQKKELIKSNVLALQKIRKNSYDGLKEDNAKKLNSRLESCQNELYIARLSSLKSSTQSVVNQINEQVNLYKTARKYMTNSINQGQISQVNHNQIFDYVREIAQRGKQTELSVFTYDLIGDLASRGVQYFSPQKNASSKTEIEIKPNTPTDVPSRLTLSYQRGETPDSTQNQGNENSGKSFKVKSGLGEPYYEHIDQK